MVLLRPNDSEARRKLGKALFQSGVRDEGLAELREALRFPRSNDADASYSLGTAFPAQGELDEVFADFSKAIYSNANIHPVHDNLAIASYR